MHDLKAILDSIPTNGCADREEAKRDLSSALSMDSSKVIENFIYLWTFTSGYEEVILDASDMRYREFIKEFEEKYRGRG